MPAVQLTPALCVSLSHLFQSRTVAGQVGAKSQRVEVEPFCDAGRPSPALSPQPASAHLRSACPPMPCHGVLQKRVRQLQETKLELDEARYAAGNAAMAELLPAVQGMRASARGVGARMIPEQLHPTVIGRTFQRKFSFAPGADPLGLDGDSAGWDSASDDGRDGPSPSASARSLHYNSNVSESKSQGSDAFAALPTDGGAAESGAKGSAAAVSAAEEKQKRKRRVLSASDSLLAFGFWFLVWVFFTMHPTYVRPPLCPQAS